MVRLTIVQLIVGTGLGTTGQSQEIHQMHLKLVLLVKFWHRWPEIKLDPPIAILIRLLFPIYMVEDKINLMEVHTDLNIESKPVLLPEVNRRILILIFLIGDSNTLTSMRATTRDILPLHFLHLDLTAQWPVTLLVDPSSN